MNKVITQEKFNDKFIREEKEILVLIETKTDGAAKYDDMWVPSNRPLAFIDPEDNSLHTESIRLEWLVEDKDWKYYFKPQTAFRVKVRPWKSKFLLFQRTSYAQVQKSSFFVWKTKDKKEMEETLWQKSITFMSEDKR